MTDAEIAAIPVKDWLSPQALLFLWTTAPMLERSMRIPRPWGFDCYTSHVVWTKDRIGTGFWARNRHEILLIYKKGRFPGPGYPVFPDSVIEAVTREHSRKPDCVADRIAEVWPNHKRLEMFARTRRPDWHVHGNQTDLFPPVGIHTG